jgi:aminopeptidase N
LSVVPQSTQPKPLVLNGEDLTLRSVAVDGAVLAPAAYTVTADSLTLPGITAPAIVEIETLCRPAENTRLEGLYVSNGTFCTQCEAEGFRRIAYFVDRPDVMAVYTVTIRADRKAAPVLLSNGNLTDTGALEDGSHFATWHDPFPKPSYLFALVAGDLAMVEDRFVTASGRDVALRIFVEHGNEDRCGYALDSLKRAMRWDEEVFGLEYDLDLFNIVAVSDFNMGAMENKSLNVFNAKYILADPQTVTDTDYALIESIVAHEYFHNWTGNRVTCRDWFQLSLKEGLTVFRDQQFSADMRSPAVRRIEDVRMLRARQFREDAGPLAHPVRPASFIEINNFYTATVYEKGAEVIRMMHTLLGEAGFRKGIDLYFERHDGQAVTCDDFVAAMADANQVNLDHFKLWYSQAGTPALTVSGIHDAQAKTYELTVSQTVPPTPDQSLKLPMHIPLSVALLDRNGDEMVMHLAGEPSGPEVTARVLAVTDSSQTFRFTDIDEPPIASLNRGFSAPINLKVETETETLGFLMARDADPFNRWESGQQFATKLMLSMVGDIQNDRAPKPEAAFIAGLAGTLDDTGLDKALCAETLLLPGEEYLADQMSVVDVDAIHAARDVLKRAIAAQLGDRFVAVYRENQTNEPYRPDADAAARRALKNRALAYLDVSPDDAARSLVVEQYRDANNMTDRMAALALLVDRDGPDRDDALDDFFDRFKDDPLVIDKWFALQARSSRTDTLNTVQALLDHPIFSIKNPNKVRALIGVFAAGNPLRFHAADGGGYRFLADQVLALNATNPQVAARLLPPLGRWRRFDDGRQAHMRAELERILATESLSKDVYEIASKSLA